MAGFSRLLLFLTMLTVSFDTFLIIQFGNLTFRFCQVTAILQVALLCLQYLTGKRRIRVDFPYVFAVLAALCIIALSSFYISFWPSRTLLYSVWLISNCILFIFATMNSVCSDKDTAHWAMKAYTVSFLLIASFGLYQTVSAAAGFPTPLVGQWVVPGRIPRLQGFSFEPSYYATYLTLGFVFTGVLLQREARDIKDFRLILATHLATLLVLVLSTARSALPVICLFYLCTFPHGVKAFLKRGHKEALAMIQLLLGPWILGIFGFMLVTKYGASFLGFLTARSGFMSTSFGPRWDGIVQSMEAFQAHPILGVGFGGFGAWLAQKGLPYLPKTLDQQALWNTTGTNVTTELMAELGILGLACALALVVSIAAVSYKAMRIQPAESTYRHWLKALLTAFVYELIILQFNQNILRPYLWFHMGLCLAIASAIRYQRREWRQIDV